MKTFWIFWIFNALISLIPIYFFFEGLGDGSVDAQNIWIWMTMLFVISLLLGGTYWLKTINQVALAKVILIVSSIPCFLVILYFIIALTGGGRWNQVLYSFTQVVSLQCYPSHGHTDLICSSFIVQLQIGVYDILLDSLVF